VTVPEIQYTTGEQAARVGNAVRGGWRIIRGRSTRGIDAADERRERQAADRTERDRRAALTAYDRALDDVAAAKNAERRARGTAKRTAGEAHRQAKQRLADAKRAARKYLA
jgi:hypothetical protein